MRRRDFLYTTGLAGTGLLATACAGPPRAPGSLADAAATGDAPATCWATTSNPEGPYYTEGAPERSVLATADTPGTLLTVSGRIVSTTDCTGLAGAVLDLWQADAAGDYDDEGFGLRGVVITDESGGFEVRTIVPGRYLDGERYRPAHIHLKASAAGHRLLTTQLYFAGDPYNDGDALFDESLVLEPEEQADGSMWASFELVLAAG